MSAPERIWAWKYSGQHTEGQWRSSLSACPTKGYQCTEYTRSDLCDPLQDERVRGLVEAARDMHDILDKPDQSDAKQGRYHYDWHKVDDAISAFRAALAALEQGGGDGAS